MNVVVLGAGAVGSVFGARVAAAGHRVTLVARPAVVEAVRRSGLRIEGVGATTVPLDAVARLVPSVRAEAVLVTVKTFDRVAAADSLGRNLRPTPTLLLLNGLGIEPAVLTTLREAGWPHPEDWVVRAVHSVPSTFLAPGVVRAVGTGEVILPAPGDRGKLAGPIELFHELLRGAGFVVRLSEDFEREVWRKVLVNAAVNPVTAVHGVPNGELNGGPLRTEAQALLAEGLAVARAEGFAFREDEVTDDLDRVVRATAENRSSMLQDLDRGRPTEIDAISGELLRRGERRGIDLPHTREAVRAVKARAEAGRSAPQA